MIKSFIATERYFIGDALIPEGDGFSRPESLGDSPVWAVINYGDEGEEIHVCDHGHV